MKWELILFCILVLIPAVNVFLVLKDNWIKRVLFSLNALVLSTILPLLLTLLIYGFTADKQGQGGYSLNPSIATLIVVLGLSILINLNKIIKFKKEKEEE